MKKQILIPIIIAVALISFFGGIEYVKLTSANNVASSTQRNMAGNFRSGQGGIGMRSQTGTAGQTPSMLRGEIVSADSTSVTVKTDSTGSKIIMFSDATEIIESKKADSKSLVKGKSVIITGSSNNDGTVTATSIRLDDGSSLRSQNSQITGSQATTGVQDSKTAITK